MKKTAGALILIGALLGLLAPSYNGQWLIGVLLIAIGAYLLTQSQEVG